jgi:TonB family protein
VSDARVGWALVLSLALHLALVGGLRGLDLAERDRRGEAPPLYVDLVEPVVAVAPMPPPAAPNGRPTRVRRAAPSRADPRASRPRDTSEPAVVTRVDPSPGADHDTSAVGARPEAHAGPRLERAEPGAPPPPPASRIAASPLSPAGPDDHEGPPLMTPSSRSPEPLSGESGPAIREPTQAPIVDTPTSPSPQTTGPERSALGTRGPATPAPSLAGRGDAASGTADTVRTPVGPGGARASEGAMPPPRLAIEDGGASGTGTAAGRVDHGSGSSAALTPGPHAGLLPEYEGYVRQFRRRLQERLAYPWLAVHRGLHGVVELEVRLDAAGRLVGVDAVAAEASHLLRDAAIQAARDATPFPFPPGLAPRALTIRFPVVFELK